MLLGQQYPHLNSIDSAENKSHNNDKQNFNNVLSSSKSDHLKILKSYYNKDASASVAKSLMNIDDDRLKSSLNCQVIDTEILKLNETSSLSSLSSASISNKLTNDQKHSNNSSESIENTEFDIQSSSYVTSASCILFLNNLVVKQLENNTDLKETSYETSKNIYSESFDPKLKETSVEKIFKKNFSLKALKNATKSSSYLAKRFSLRNRKSDEALDEIKSESERITFKASKSKLASNSAASDLIENGSRSRAEKIKNHELSNSSSSYSNISSSNSSQAYNSQLSQQNLPKQQSTHTEYETSSNDQLDCLDTLGTSNTNSKMFHINQTKLRYNSNQTISYNNNNFYNQNLLLSKKLRKYLPNNQGLRNHGNTCFMNCILQCLFHTSPLADFFITEQFEQDMQVITHQQKILQNPIVPQFILTKHFYRLLSSMWRNTYDSNYSYEFKQLVAHLNPTFSGGTQNDSHELCVWLLDKLSQELSLKIPGKITESVSKGAQPQTTSSFVEELFQVEFKSTVVCSKCNYHSSKYENDMMLSLPLPQNQVLKPDLSKKMVKQRRSLYPFLILTNQSSIKNMISSDNLDQTDATSSRSKFYVSPTHQQTSNLDSNLNSTSNSHYTIPFHAKIGCDILINSGLLYEQALDLNTPFSINNPSIGDFRKYISTVYQLKKGDLVFINLNHFEKNLTDVDMIKESFFTERSNLNNDLNTLGNNKTDNPIDSMCIMELSSPTSNRADQQMPLINIIGINVYEAFDQSGFKRLVCYGLPFVLLINRDCSYSDLCRKLLEAQSKYFKDKNMLKYKDLVEKLFTLSINSSSEQVRLNSSDELPLYAECVEKAINECQLSVQDSNNVEYIKLNIEWKSFEGIYNLFKEIDYGKAEFVHRSVKHLQKIEIESTFSGSDYASVKQTNSANHATNSTTATLDDCFELFTEREHLTDENSWMCPKCQKQTSAFKSLSISQVPPILIIHLKRFFYKSKTSNFKLTTPVWFPVNGLNISKYIDKSTRMKQMSETNGFKNVGSNSDLDYYDSSECEGEYETTDVERKNPMDSSDDLYMYDLFGVANHKGTNMANGHYTAFCKNLVDTKWYCFDDASCTTLSEISNHQNGTSNIFNNGSNGVWTENAYILFYKKRNCMRNERWWTSYIDRSLYEHDEFDRFLHNLDQIEEEQKKYQQTQQIHQLKQHQLSNKIQIMSKDNLNNNYSNGNKKPTGLNKIRNMLSNGTHKKDNEDFNYLNNTGAIISQTNPIEVKHYDENVKPNRLLKQNKCDNSQSNIHVGSSAQPASQQMSTGNILSINTITDLPSSDSNNSLNNSSFIYTNNNSNLTRTNHQHRSNCFNTKVEPYEDSYTKIASERSPTSSTRVSNDSNQLLYKYPADNDYNYEHSNKIKSSSNSEFIYEKKISPQSKNIYEYNPRHRPIPEKMNSQSKLSSQMFSRSPSSSASLGLSSKSPRSISQQTNGRYINPASIETPI